MAGSAVARCARFTMNGRAIPLAVVFGIVSAAAFAQTNDPVSQLRACSTMERAERLKCLDDLSRNIDQATGSVEANRWTVSETTSPVDYRPIVTASTFSRGPDGSSAQLSISCRGGRTEMVITGSTLSGRAWDYATTYSINRRPPVQVPTGSSSSGAGVAVQGDVVRLLQSFPDEGEIAIHLASRTAAAIDLSFPLGGVKSVREKIAAACKWPSAVASPRP